MYRKHKLSANWDIKIEKIIFSFSTKYTRRVSNALPQGRATIINNIKETVHLPKKQFIDLAILNGKQPRLGFSQRAD